MKNCAKKEHAINREIFGIFSNFEPVAVAAQATRKTESVQKNLNFIDKCSSFATRDMTYMHFKN